MTFGANECAYSAPFSSPVPGARMFSSAPSFRFHVSRGFGGAKSVGSVLDTEAKAVVAARALGKSRVARVDTAHAGVTIEGLFLGSHAGFDFIDFTHGLCHLQGGSRMPPVDLSELCKVVNHRVFGFVDIEIHLVGKVISLDSLFVENLNNGGLSPSFSGLVLGCEPFEASDIEFLSRGFVLLLDDLDDAGNLCLHSLLLDGEIPAGDDFLIGVLFERKNGSDHDSFVKGNVSSLPCSFELPLLLVAHDFLDSINLVGIDHHGFHGFVVDFLAWPGRS